MKYYKLNNEVYAYDEEQVAIGLADGKTELTSEELELHLNPPKTDEQIKAEIESAIQLMLDAKAKELRYDNMMSARSYAGFENPFQAEAQSLAVWCSNCWLKADELEALGTVMTVEEVLAQMPTFQGDN
jgi:hypothetical protein